MERVLVDVPPTERPGIQESLPDVLRKLIAIPDAEVRVLVPTQKKTLRAERRKHVVHSSEPLRHAVVVRILGLEGELVDGSFERAHNTALTDTSIGSDLPHAGISVGDQAQADVTIGERSPRRAVGRSDKLVVKKWRPHGQLGP